MSTDALIKKKLKKNSVTCEIYLSFDFIARLNQAINCVIFTYWTEELANRFFSVNLRLGKPSILNENPFFWSITPSILTPFDAEWNSASSPTTFRVSPSFSANISKVYFENSMKNPVFRVKTPFFAWWPPSKISSSDREFNSTSSPRTFRRSPSCWANISKVY